MLNKIFFMTFLLLALSLVCFGQFNSGSTGADGALDLSACTTTICEVPLPESGILNYTTVNVPAGKTLVFKPNSRNTPVTILAQGNININGSINLNASGRNPGAGGYHGGNSSSPQGFGPGGGQSTSVHGKWVGALSLVPIIGGSGGASPTTNNIYFGGGGGGAIVLASSSSVFINQTSSFNISVDGSVGWTGASTCSSCGSGSGGSIRIVANFVNISGNLYARAGGFSPYVGTIRIEAPAGQRNVSGTFNPTPVISEINPVVIPTNPPTLRIASIAGYPVPTGSAGSPYGVDLMLSAQLSDPLQVQIQGFNIPVGTQIQLLLSGASGTATGCALTGETSWSACNVSVTGLNRNGVTTLLAVAVFEVPTQTNAFNPEGENKVSKVRLETALGGKPKYTFLRANGNVIDAKNLSLQFLQQFGM